MCRIKVHQTVKKSHLTCVFSYIKKETLVTNLNFVQNVEFIYINLCNAHLIVLFILLKIEMCKKYMIKIFE